MFICPGPREQSNLTLNPRNGINKEGLLQEMNLVSPANWLAMKGSGVIAKGLTLSLGVNKDRLVTWLILPVTQTYNGRCSITKQVEVKEMKLATTYRSPVLSFQLFQTFGDFGVSRSSYFSLNPCQIFRS